MKVGRIIFRKIVCYSVEKKYILMLVGVVIVVDYHACGFDTLTEYPMFYFMLLGLWIGSFFLFFLLFFYF